MANELTFKLMLNDDGTYKLKKFGSEVEKTQKKHESASKKMEQSFGGVGTAATVAFGAVSAATLAALHTGMEYGAQIAENSQKYGIHASQLSGMALAARMSSIDMDKLGSSMGKMAKLVGSANDGNVQSIATLKSLNIEWKNADGTLRDQNDLMTQVAKRFADMPDGIQKTTEAQKLFGKSGADLIPMLNGGADALAEMQDKAQKLGLALTDVQAANLDDLGDSMDMLFEGIKGAAVQFTAEASPGLKLFFDEFQSMASDTMPFIQNLGEFFGKTMVHITAGIYGFIGTIKKSMAYYADLQSMMAKVHAATTFGETKREHLKDAADWAAKAAKYHAESQEKFDKSADLNDLDYKHLKLGNYGSKPTTPPPPPKPNPTGSKNAPKKQPEIPESKWRRTTLDITNPNDFAPKEWAEANDTLEQYRQNTIKKAEDQAKEIERMRMDMMGDRERDMAELEQNYKEQRQKMLDNAQGLAVAEQQYLDGKKKLEDNWHAEDLQKQMEHTAKLQDIWNSVGDLASQVNKTFGIEAGNAINSIAQIGDAMFKMIKLAESMNSPGASILDAVVPGLGIATQILGGLDGMFATGGIAEKPMRIMAGEQGPEGILNARATRTLGKEFVHAANAGNFNALQIPARTSNRTTNITINTQGLSQRDIEQTVIPAIQRANRRI